MQDDQLRIKSQAQAIRKDPGRSAVFGYMLANAETFVLASVEGQIDWVAVAALLTTEGVLDATGKPATPERARKTWYKVRQFIARREAKAASEPRPVKVPPSRLPPDARPAPLPAPEHENQPQPSLLARRGPKIPALSGSAIWGARKAPDPAAKPGSAMTGAEKITALRQTLKDDF